jgi:hypothetical protein
MSTGPRGSANDAALVLAAITDAVMCAECIAKKTALPLVRVQATLEAVAGSLKVRWHESRCAACLTTKMVFWLA